MVVQRVVNGSDVFLPDHQSRGMFCAACAAVVEITTKANPAPSLDAQFLWEQQRQSRRCLLVAELCSMPNQGVKPH